MNLGEKPP